MPRLLLLLLLSMTVIFAQKEDKNPTMTTQKYAFSKEGFKLFIADFTEALETKDQAFLRKTDVNSTNIQELLALENYREQIKVVVTAMRNHKKNTIEPLENKEYRGMNFRIADLQAVYFFFYDEDNQFYFRDDARWQN
jgi:hypothetical protein